jgi:3D (Asp-Asp-Asp) domain-containing protein
MVWVLVLTVAIIALLYPRAVIAEDGTNLGPSPIWMMAIETQGGVSNPPQEHETVLQTIATTPQEAHRGSQRLQASVSAFNSEVGQTDDTPFITASGTHVHSQTAACPSRYPFGTRIRVQGMGEYICEDRMNARYREGDYFDLWMADRESAIQWGRRTVSVVIL